MVKKKKNVFDKVFLNLTKYLLKKDMFIHVGTIKL